MARLDSGDELVDRVGPLGDVELAEATRLDLVGGRAPANDDDDGDDDAPPAADALLEAPSASPSVAPPSTGELASFRQARAAKLAASPFGS